MVSESAAPAPIRQSIGAALAPWIVLFGSLALIWWSSWDHPLHAPDEGRYGTVSAEMAEHGTWLVPHFRGLPHLTKPPLIYWAQAAGISLLGQCEMAIRLPSLIAGSLALFVLFGFAWRLLGREFAMLAVGLYGVMPLPLFFARVATTDAVLNLCWFSALASTVLALDARNRGRASALAWLMIAWVWVGVAALDKGPIAPAPMVIVASWLLLARRWSDLRWFVLHGIWGAVIALAPIGLWIWQIIERHPEALQVWREQFVDRFLFGSPAQSLVAQQSLTDESAYRADPFWLYLPIFLAGMFPATCAMVLPWFNMRLRQALHALTQGDLRALLLIAVLGPIAFFSLAKGKMPAYILPVAAPLAMLVAGTLARASRLGRTMAPLGVEKAPDVRITFMVVALLSVAGAITAGAVLDGWNGARVALLFSFVPIGAALAAFVWAKGVDARRSALAIIWVTLVATMLALEHIEDEFLTHRGMGARGLVERVRTATGSEHPQFIVYSLRNPTIDFYSRSDPVMVWSVGDLRQIWSSLRPDHAILVSMPVWKWIECEYPRLAEVLVPLHPEGDGDADERSDSVWNRWPGKPTMVLRMVAKAQDDAERDNSSISSEPSD